MRLYAPALFAEQVFREQAPVSFGAMERSVSELLLLALRNHPAGCIYNKMRTDGERQLLPYRALAHPLRGARGEAGMVVALRDQKDAGFDHADLLSLRTRVVELEQQLTSRVETGTGLLTRSAFEVELAGRESPDRPVCVLYGNLDRMHAVNDSLGLAGGDQVISDVGRRWADELQGSRSIATHLSGDRYVAVLFVATLNQASAYAERVRASIERIRCGKRKEGMSVSIGVAEVGADQSVQHTLAVAETACRVAKDRGRNRVEIYMPADATIIRRHAQMRTFRIVRDAIESDRCVLYAQPIVALSADDGRQHFEILLRIRGANGDCASIGDYLQAAERYQFLERLDRWVIERTLRALAPLTSNVIASFSVNISGQSLSEPSFADFVRTEMKRHAIPAGVLDFEFTETAAVRNLNAARRFIERLQNVGAHIALDDFGTGLSSLALLKDLRVDRIKIDGRFVRDILHDACSQAVVAALVQIARRLNLTTVAEFVETREQAEHLRTLGVHCAQGHLYGGARPLEQILTAFQHSTPGEQQRTAP